MIQFAELKIDALLVSALPNIRYLSGFTGSNLQLNGGGISIASPLTTTPFASSFTSMVRRSAFLQIGSDGLVIGKTKSVRSRSPEDKHVHRIGTGRPPTSAIMRITSRTE